MATKTLTEYGPGLRQEAGERFGWEMFGPLNIPQTEYVREPAGLTRKQGYVEFVQIHGAPVVQAAVRPRASGAREEFFRTLLEHWGLTPNDGAVLIGYGRTGLARLWRVLVGLATFESRDEHDRVLELFTIRKILTSLFRNREYERDWLREPKAELGGRSPMDLLLEGSLFNLLRVRQFLETIAGF